MNTLDFSSIKELRDLAAVVVEAQHKVTMGQFKGKVVEETARDLAVTTDALSDAVEEIKRRHPPKYPDIDKVSMDLLREIYAIVKSPIDTIDAADLDAKTKRLAQHVHKTKQDEIKRREGIWLRKNKGGPEPGRYIVVR